MAAKCVLCGGPVAWPASICPKCGKTLAPKTNEEDDHGHDEQG